MKMLILKGLNSVDAKLILWRELIRFWLFLEEIGLDIVIQGKCSKTVLI